MLPDTIGMSPGQLPDDARQALDSMGAQHADVERELGRLQDEISRLFDRTSLNRYGDVAHDMDTQKTGDALAGLANLVSNNVGAETIGSARHWGDQFEQWAKRLSDSDSSKSGQSGKGRGQPDPAQMQALMALMRLRQQQGQLREQTAALDEQKSTNQDYPAGAQDAGRQQGALHDAEQAMEQDPNFPVQRDQMQPIGKAMGDAATLLAKPETGQPTNAAQTDALNLLDAAIGQQAKKSGASASALMAMMGVGSGSAGGKGSTAGGTTTQPNVPIPGSREGAQPDQRTIIQAGGIDNSPLPGEFRDAIESYHRAIEQSAKP